MVIKPVRSLCYTCIFGLNGSQHLRATNKNVTLIYSVTINEKTTKDYARSGCKDPYIVKLHTLFLSLIIADFNFITSLLH